MITNGFRRAVVWTVVGGVSCAASDSFIRYCNASNEDKSNTSLDDYADAFQALATMSNSAATRVAVDPNRLDSATFAPYLEKEGSILYPFVHYDS